MLYNNSLMRTPGSAVWKNSRLACAA